MSMTAVVTDGPGAPLAAPEGAAAGRLAVLAPRPTTLVATGLSAELLGDLASKLLLRAGVLSLSALAERLGISGNILVDIMALLRREARIEVRPGVEPELAYVLSERGRQLALDALHRDGYVGRAPVRLEEYARVVAAQTVHRRFVTRATMQRAFTGLVLSEDIRDRLGAALNSGRAMFLHGAPGTGKTYVAGRLGRAFSGEILVPHAILVNGAIVRLLDPAIHEDLELCGAASPLLLSAGFDPRYVCCERPVVHAGGEIELSMLEVARHEGTRELLAPLQLKANNGLLIIDDLGRQRAAPEQILNRWIVPMEERIDHFSIDGSTHFTVPFDVVLVFSTNLKPQTLADDALLRRLGYKIEFKPIPADSYRKIWENTCRSLQLTFERELVDFAIEELYGKRGAELLPCHPRDLLNMAVDRLRYEESDALVDRELLTWAWDNYFLQSR
jgi:hypothetical protein